MWQLEEGVRRRAPVAPVAPALTPTPVMELSNISLAHTAHAARTDTAAGDSTTPYARGGSGEAGDMAMPARRRRGGTAWSVKAVVVVLSAGALAVWIAAFVLLGQKQMPTYVKRVAVAWRCAVWWWCGGVVVCVAPCPPPPGTEHAGV